MGLFVICNNIDLYQHRQSLQDSRVWANPRHPTVSSTAVSEAKRLVAVGSDDMTVSVGAGRRVVRLEMCRACSVGTRGSPGKSAPSHGRRKSANAGKAEEGADRDHRHRAGTRRVHLGDRLLGLAGERCWLTGRQKHGRRGDGQGVDAGLGNPPPKIGSGSANLRGSDRGSPTTHTWHAITNPRIRNCSTVANAPAP